MDRPIAMLRLTSYVYFLALTTLVAGLFACWALYRPAGLAEALGVAVYLVFRAAGNPWFWTFLATALGFGLVARFYEHRGGSTPLRRGVHALEHGGGATGPIARRRLSRRLPALLRGGDMIAFVDELLAGALVLGASDLHVEPHESATRLVLRIEGELEEVASLPATRHGELLRRLKVLADLVPYKTDTAQDGRFSIERRNASDPVDVRISVVPTHHGEKAVLRFLRAGAARLGLGELGMEPAVASAFGELLRAPQGLVVLTGPTGSGKTTTLYAALEHLHGERGASVQIATIEDPVEIDLPFLSQTQVDRVRGLDFAGGLRALLRQDPDVLMVGEIRDPETAQIAVQAGLTGHLVLTTLQADSAAGIFPRLIDLGVEPFLAASATLASISQRLVPALCPRCRRPARPGEAALGDAPFVAAGCHACGQSGVAGRSAIFEFLRVTPELRQAIAERATLQEIEGLARDAGMVTLIEAARTAARAGRIGADQLARVTG